MLTTHPLRFPADQCPSNSATTPECPRRLATSSESAKRDRGSGRRRRILFAGFGLLLVAPLVTWWLVGRYTAPGSPPAIRIAVLPFHGLNASASDWEQGLTEALVVNLTEEGEGHLVVIGPAMTAPAASEGLPQGELGRRLGADYVLSGGIRADGESVFAQLLSAPGGEHLWATVQPLGEPDAVGVELASAVVGALDEKAIPDPDLKRSEP